MNQGIQGQNPKAWFDSARVAIPGYTEVLWQPLYDYKAKTAAAQSSLRFFAEGAGSGTKTLSDTNMVLNSVLSKGQAFKATGIQVEFYPDLDITLADATAGVAAQQEYANDLMDFYKSGRLIFTIGTTPYLIQANLMQFAPQRHLKLMAAYATTVAATTIKSTYAHIDGEPFRIVDKLLESNMQFGITLEDLAATSTTGKIGVRLLGYLGRNAQG